MTDISPSGDGNVAPYAGLTPETILDALDGAGLRTDGRMLALNSFENRVYQLGLEEGGFVVAKFYRTGRWSDAAILEEHAFVAELAGAELPVVAPLTLGGRTLNLHQGFRFAVYPRQGGRSPEFDSPEVLPWMGRLLGRIHALGAGKRFRARPALDVNTFGEEPRAFMKAHALLPPELESVYFGLVDLALDGVRRCFDRAGRVATLRLHGDCHAGNVLWTDRGPHFVDFDDARSGPAVQDLWMLLSGDMAAMSRQMNEILSGYRQFRDFNLAELQLVEALRTLRLIHYAAWLARRWDDPAFPAAFPWFGTPRYWQDRILELREQIALMDSPEPWDID
ncbi:MAG: serine/threonine protein kinase [Rhodocyclaceae bacterium]|nr:serine/threonine protein kinase [Rhodocyclaceae bacterium]